ncbi:hypothetical protein DTO271D3_8600 [Paecilomyces variotii]|nr:hypothetical protein DTO271D3_8600 [Paecilomyces variotii]KAJ9379213.1 hypothetical protein DTO063F5_7312 [Paecilomyces variotii]
MSGCWAMHSGTIQRISVDVPCGRTNSTHPYVTCCVAGDYCLSNSICEHVSTDGTKGYYNADCTDPTLQDPACGTRCGGRRESDLVFIQDRGVWACCTSDNGTIDCNNPSIEVYPGPATADLATIQYVPATGTPTYPAPTGTATSTSNATVTQTPSSSSGVSPGAAAGIGVGVGAGVALAAFMIAFLFMRNRRQAQGRSSATAPAGYNSVLSPTTYQTSPAAWTAEPEVRQAPIYELSHPKQPRGELDSQ